MTQVKLEEALDILKALGMPRRQINERSALVLLALVDVGPDGNWSDSSAPLLGIASAMEWMKLHYDKAYKTGTRESIRRQTLHQFINAGIVLYNSDNPSRAVNSPKASYRIAPRFLSVLKSYGTSKWEREINSFTERQLKLAARYSKERQLRRIPVVLTDGQELTLSGGEHSELLRDIIEDFGSRFAGGGRLLYVGDTGAHSNYVDSPGLQSLGITLDVHGKLPDVILLDTERHWLFLIEAVTSHGPVDTKRHDELIALFKKSKIGTVYVTAFLNRSTMGKYLGVIAWETEVWVADSPSHLIHFNGDRFLGPY